MIPLQLRRLPLSVILLLLTLLPYLSTAQDGKTAKLMAKAEEYFSSNNTVDAEILYNQVLSGDPSNFRAAYQLGRINSFLKDYREALRWFRKAEEIDAERNDTLFLQIGLTYKRLDNYRKAKEYFETFKAKHGTKDAYYERAELEIQGCELAEASIASLPDFRIKAASFNSSSSDNYPSILDQRQEDKFLVFTSYRPLPGRRAKTDKISGEAKDSDIYYIIRENDSIFGEITRFPKKRINTKFNDGPASITGDGLTIYFSVCGGKKNRNGCTIFESRYDPIKKQWGKASILEGVSGRQEVVINSRGKTKSVPTNDRQPFITRDGRTLFFASSRGGGEGGYDIWFSRRVGSGWSEPQNLGPTVNTAFNESSPFINDANNRLYFASDGLAGFGGLDLYYSEGSIGNFSEPVNLGAPINSSYNDFGSLWMDDDSLVYFTSDRPGGAGRDDIYIGRRIYREPVPLNIAVKGVVRDKTTKQPIEFATAILYERSGANSLTVIDTFETDQSARYEFPLEEEKNYVILGNAPEYLANEEEVSTMGIDKDTDLVKNIDIELEPIILTEPITIDNIYYDFDEYYLREDALVELAKLVDLLNKNPNITIELGSHTDSNGTEIYNINLSDNRAKAVVKFLVESGINPSRLSWRGFGENQLLIYPEMSDYDEQANRRTEFRIMSIEFLP